MSNLPAISFTENELSAARLVIPFTPLKQLGPKHHAIVLGTNDEDGEIWIAELSKFGGGHRLRSLKEFVHENRDQIDRLELRPNDGQRSNGDVVRSVLNELQQGASPKYHLLLNNCETFVDRHTYGNWKLSSQVATALKGLGFVITTAALAWQSTRKRS